jgi:hypothetical protein
LNGPFRHGADAIRHPQTCRSEKERIVATAPIQNAHKKAAQAEPTEEEHPPHQQTDTERYQLQIDRQTKRSFETLESARSAAVEIKTRFPTLQVSIYDSASKSRTMIDLPSTS